MAKKNRVVPHNARSKAARTADVAPTLSAPQNWGFIGVSGAAMLPALILVYLLLAVAYSAITPAATPDQHNPDENAHMEYVMRVASGHLPVFTDPQHGYENHQPPLYYALCAPVYLAARGLGAAAATRAVRGVSIGLGALLIWVTFRCVATLFPGENALALGTAAFVGLLPGNVALSASVTNDTLTNLLCAVCLWRLAVLAAAEQVKKEALWLGLLLGGGIWIKTSALALFPVGLLAWYGLARQGRLPAKEALRGGGLSLGLGLLIGLPWLIRNTLLYGDPVAQHLFVTAFAGTAQADDVAHYVFHGSVGGYLQGVARWTFASFWGVFDSMRLFWGQEPHGRTPSPAVALPPLYDFPALLSVPAVIGIALHLRCRHLSTAQQVLMAAFAALSALVAFAFLRFNLTFFQAQGRYLYPALLPLAFFFVWGWQGLLPRWLGVFTALMAVSLVGLNLYTLFGLLLPRFAV